ncbi:MAG: hypothetical protein EA388_06535 [Nitriliruptor sp.]|nr:MAG: hypothetical protein EA388_06535 [Nitriliruptor sp.]
MGHRSQLPDLVAVHRDPRAARQTIERLSRAGIDGGLIELLSTTEVVTAGRYSDRQVDLGSSLLLAGRVLRGIGWGIGPGALFGVGLLAIATELNLRVVAAGAGGGALLGVAIGTLIALLTVPTMATSWERTFAPMVPGGIVIGVRIDNRRIQRRARRVLDGCGAHSLREVVDLDELPGPEDGTPDLEAS